MSLGRTVARAALVGTVMVLTGTSFSIRSSSSTAAVATDARSLALGPSRPRDAAPSIIGIMNLAPAEQTTAAPPARSAALNVNSTIPILTRFEPHEALDADLTPASLTTASRVVTARKGDTLMDILVRSGVPSDDAESAIASLREVYDPRDLKAGQDVTLVFAPAPGSAHDAAEHAATPKTKPAAAKKPAGDLVALRIQPDAKSEVGASRAGEGGFSPVQVEKRLVTKETFAAGRIDSSLFEAAQAAGVPPKVLTEMIHVFSYDVDFQRDIQPGDGFQVAFETKADGDDNVVETGRVLYAEMVLSGTRLPLYLYTTKDGDTDYFNARGESVHKALMRTPVDGAHLTSGFGKRKHPILGYSRMHQGVDFGAPRGTPIMAAGSGVVEMAQRYSGYGNYIKLRHGPVFETAYGHMTRFAKGIHRGVRVTQGQVIGYVGSTGLATGPHLHFEVIRNGSKVNPLSVNLPSGRKLKGKDLERFLAAKDKVDQLVAQLAADTTVASSH